MMWMLEPIFKIILAVIVCAVIVFPFRQTIGLRHLDDIKENAPEFLKQNGFEVIGRQGFQTSLFLGSAVVWYTMKRGEHIFECCVAKRRGEYQLYSLRIKDAVNISVEQ